MLFPNHMRSMAVLRECGEFKVHLVQTLYFTNTRELGTREIKLFSQKCLVSRENISRRKANLLSKFIFTNNSMKGLSFQKHPHPCPRQILESLFTKQKLTIMTTRSIFLMEKKTCLWSYRMQCNPHFEY